MENVWCSSIKKYTTIILQSEHSKIIPMNLNDFNFNIVPKINPSNKSCKKTFLGNKIILSVIKDIITLQNNRVMLISFNVKEPFHT